MKKFQKSEDSHAIAPILGKQNISPDFLLSYKNMTMASFELRADIHYAMNLPDNGKYCIKMKLLRKKIQEY